MISDRNFNRSARPYFPPNSLLFLQRLYDAEILHGLRKLHSEILHELIFRLIHYFFYNNYMMQKFCMAWKSGCRNSARTYFPQNSQVFLQQLYDAEILHGLKKLDAEILHEHIFQLIHKLSYNNYMIQKFCMAWKSWMQKFCTNLFSAKYANKIIFLWTSQAQIDRNNKNVQPQPQN